MTRMWSFVLMLLALAGCAQKPSFEVDNPGASALTVEVDGQRHEVAAGESQMISLAPGRHRMAMTGQAPVEFVVYANSKGGLLNPTRSTYVLMQLVYARDEKSFDQFTPPESTINVLGRRFDGPLRRIDDVVIDGNVHWWRFGPTEAADEKLLADARSKGNIHGKLFRERDFVAFWDADPALAEFYGDPDRRRIPDSPLYGGEPVSPSVFANPKLRQLMQERHHRAMRYAEAEDAGTQAAQIKAWQQHTIANVAREAELIGSLDLSPGDRKAMEAFGKWETGLWMAGVRLVDATSAVGQGG